MSCCWVQIDLSPLSLVTCSTVSIWPSYFLKHNACSFSICVKLLFPLQKRLSCYFIARSGVCQISPCCKDCNTDKEGMFVVETPTERQNCRFLTKNEIQMLFGILLCYSYALKHSRKIKIITFFFLTNNNLLDLQPDTEQEDTSIWFASPEVWCWLFMNGAKAQLKVSILFVPGALQKFIILWHCATKCHSWPQHCHDEQNALNKAAAGISTDPEKINLALSDSFLLLLMGIETELQEI